MYTQKDLPALNQKMLEMRKAFVMAGMPATTKPVDVPNWICKATSGDKIAYRQALDYVELFETVQGLLKARYNRQFLIFAHSVMGFN